MVCVGRALRVYSPRRAGIGNVNAEPTPSSLFTQIRPPWSSTNLRHKVEPRALDLLGRRPYLTELLEDLLLILRGDADPGVANGHLHESVLWHCANVDAPTFG